MQNRTSSAITLIPVVCCGGRGSRAECRRGNSLYRCFCLYGLRDSDVRGSSIADSAIDQLQ